MKIALGVDIGGSHITSAAIDLDKKILIDTSLFENDVDNKASKEIIISQFAETINKSIEAVKHEEILGIGIAMPGPFDYVNGIGKFELVDKYESLFNVNVGEELNKIINLKAPVPVRFINDATAFGIGESWVGAGKDAERLIVLTLGTGFGSAFLYNGIPVVNDIFVPKKGCFWHLKFKDGIADDYISTRWFVNSWNSRSEKKVKGVKEISQMVYTDEYAREIFEEYGRNLGEIMKASLKKFAPQSIVIGGNIIGAYNLFGPALEKTISDAGLKIEIRLTDLKEKAALIGSARMVEESFWPSCKQQLVFMQ
jgi:glucokinase